MYGKMDMSEGLNMTYKEYTVFTSVDDLDNLVDQLYILGFEGLIINDPRDAEMFKEGGETSYEWNFVSDEVIKELESGAKVSFYIEESKEISKKAEAFLKSYDLKLALVKDDNWLHAWEEYYVPTKLGAVTVAKPVWRDYEPKQGEIVIDIDPGLAFGTGTSPTTYLAVRLIEKYLKPGDEVLDVGCGTGILSILAAKLGAKHVNAIDLDPKAIESTNVNIELNKCQDIVDVYQGDLLKDFSFKADFIEANLTAEIVINLCQGLKDHCSGRGFLVASGIIDIKEDMTAKAIEAAGFDIVETIKDNCWVAIAAVARGDMTSQLLPDCN